MLNFSLYVGTITRIRSVKASPVPPDPDGKRQQADQDGDPGDGLAGLIRGARELETHRSRSSRQLDPDEGQIGAAQPSRLAVYGSPPSRVIVLRDDERGAFRSRGAQSDFHLAGLVSGHVCRDGKWLGERP